MSSPKSWSFREYVKATVVGAALFMSVPQAHAGLAIILTNDDGFGEPGIEALTSALRAAGHSVTVGAPDGNTSTSSASLDSQRPFVQVICNLPTAHDCKVRSVCVEGVTLPEGCATLEHLGAATPLASVLATTAAVGKDPADFDLLISGINSGSNAGPRVVYSGTVGAVIGAASKNVGNVPAIAVSLESNDNATVEEAADFVVELVADLERQATPGGRLLPDGVALNVNYPDLAPEDVAGVELTVQGRFESGPRTEQMFVTRSVPFQPLADQGVFVPEGTTVPQDGEEVRDADTTALEQGFITITAFEADYTASSQAQEDVEWLLRDLLGSS